MSAGKLLYKVDYIRSDEWMTLTIGIVPIILISIIIGWWSVFIVPILVSVLVISWRFSLKYWYFYEDFLVVKRVVGKKESSYYYNEVVLILSKGGVNSPPQLFFRKFQNNKLIGSIFIEAPKELSLINILKNRVIKVKNDRK